MRRLRLPEDVSRSRRVMAALAVVTLAASGTAWLVGEVAHAPTADEHEVPGVEPLRTTLHRCRTIGGAALAHARCRTTWSAHRERFLGIQRSGGVGR